MPVSTARVPRTRPMRAPDVSDLEPVRSPRDGGWLTPPEASARLALDLDGHTVQVRTIQHWCRTGRLPSKRLGRRLLIHWTDLLAVLDGRAGTGAPVTSDA